MERVNELNNFYTLLNKLESKFPKRPLSELNRESLPLQGVYFFFDIEQKRNNSNNLKVIRIGTHAARINSKTTLYNRLTQHKGTNTGFGSHRSSIFRELVGLSYINKESLNISWGQQTLKTIHEKELEKRVSEYLGNLFFTVISIPGESHKDNDRAYIEKNSIALLSNYNKEPIDDTSESWLGKQSKKEKVISSGLWNNCYVESTVDEEFLKKLNSYV